MCFCSNSCFLGFMAVLDLLHKELRSRGALADTFHTVSSYCPQTQSRTRGCSTAQHGGSTHVCTATGQESRSCNPHNCRRMTNQFKNHCCFVSSCYSSHRGHLGLMAGMDGLQCVLWGRGELAREYNLRLPGTEQDQEV